MRFYHFTQKKNVDSILKHGVRRGLTPYRDISNFKAVSLTTIASPHGHGLITGQTVRETDPEYPLASQHYPNGVTRNALGQYSVKMFDQTEAMLIIELNPSSSKLVSHQQLFDKILSNGLMKADAQIDRERYEIMNGQRDHKAATWYFYLGNISPSKVVQVRFKQNDGLYS